VRTSRDHVGKNEYPQPPVVSDSISSCVSTSNSRYTFGVIRALKNVVAFGLSW